jgi:hypothetical protein
MHQISAAHLWNFFMNKFTINHYQMYCNETLSAPSFYSTRDNKLFWKWGTGLVSNEFYVFFDIFGSSITFLSTNCHSPSTVTKHIVKKHLVPSFYNTRDNKLFWKWCKGIARGEICVFHDIFSYLFTINSYQTYCKKNTQSPPCIAHETTYCFENGTQA